MFRLTTYRTYMLPQLLLALAALAGCRAERAVFVFRASNSVKFDSSITGYAGVTTNDAKQRSCGAYARKVPTHLKNNTFARPRNTTHTQVRTSSLSEPASIRPNPQRWLLKSPQRRRKAPNGYDGKGLAEAFYTFVLALIFLLVAVVGLFAGSPAAIITGAIGFGAVVLLYAAGITNDFGLK